ncbi:MAG: PAS domain S-box protein, partial [Alphaproteobacteria bacterium]|nr:PAS domain S-box protein [Alphaproteobacteria bacterium]
MTGLRLSRTLGLAVILGALTVMAGWVWDTPLLRNPFPGTIDMKFNTALGFLLQGIALLLVLRGDGAAWGRPLAKVLALASAAHGGLVVSEYVFAYDSGFSQFFIQEGKDAILTVHLGRPAPITAVTFILLGVSLMQDRLDRWWSRPLPLFAGAASLLGLFGYVYQSPHLYTVVPSATGIAILTVLFFLLLTAGVLTAHPEHPVSAVVLDSGPAGILARTLLPVAILLPLAAEFVTSLGAKWGVYGENNEHVVHALLVAVALVYVCLKTARVLLGVDDLRRRAEKGLLEREKRLRLLLDSVDDGIYGLNREGETTFVNPAAVRALGWTAAEMLGLHLHGM